MDRDETIELIKRQLAEALGLYQDAGIIWMYFIDNDLDDAPIEPVLDALVACHDAYQGLIAALENGNEAT